MIFKLKDFLKFIKNNSFPSFLALSFLLAIIVFIFPQYKVFSFTCSALSSVLSLVFTLSLFYKTVSKAMFSYIPVVSVFYISSSTISFFDDFYPKNFLFNNYLVVVSSLSLISLSVFIFCLYVYSKNSKGSISILSFYLAVVSFLKNSITVTTLIITCSSLIKFAPSNSALRLFTIFFPLFAQFLIYLESIFSLMEKKRANTKDTYKAVEEYFSKHSSH